MTDLKKEKATFNELQAKHVRQCWKEVLFVAVVWVATLVFCTTMFVTMGYIPLDERPEVPSMVLGIPSWVFWGLFAPWFVLVGVVWWFAARFLKDDETYMDYPDGNDTGK